MNLQYYNSVGIPMKVLLSKYFSFVTRMNTKLDQQYCCDLNFSIISATYNNIAIRA